MICDHGLVRTTFTKDDENMEVLGLHRMREQFLTDKKSTFKPVAVFGWKLLDITEIWEPKTPNFLATIQKRVDCFHKNLTQVKERANSYVYEYEYENKGDDSELLKAFLENNAWSEFLKVLFHLCSCFRRVVGSFMQFKTMRCDPFVIFSRILYITKR